jgi:hypothetical protein
VTAPHRADLSLFVDILRTLEAIGAPYMIIGAFAAATYGSTRVTYDIDIVVDLSADHVQRLADAYPSPRFYADPEQMRDSIRRGMMFNIIDSSRGEKADLIPLTMAVHYARAFQRRVQQVVELPGGESFRVWCARAEDVIVGKLLAWAEGHSRKHESDIREMLIFNSLEAATRSVPGIDLAFVDAVAGRLGEEVAELWQTIKRSAREEAERGIQ